MGKNGLSIEQEKAAKLIAVGKLSSDSAIAKKVRVKLSTLRSWKNDPMFKLRVMQAFEGEVDVERTYRFKKINFLLKPVYREVRRRLREEDVLEDIPFRDLLRILVQLQSELRSDSRFDKGFLKPIGEKESDQEEQGEETADEMYQVRQSYTELRKEAAANSKGKVIPIR
uniref:Uncharacterized protein n=1 Tax=viral metagenome TaxID=1070528 RepID=A0A6M3KAP4_9ZZZZ